MDHDHPLRQRDHIGHVVAGEQDRGPVCRVVVEDELRSRFCIVTSSPIVGSSRKSTSGPWRSAPTISIFMRSPSDRLRTGLVTRSATSSKLGVRLHAVPEVLLRDLVDRAVQLEGVRRGEVPLQVVALTHHEGDPERRSLERSHG
jgi:hypothetical protein